MDEDLVCRGGEAVEVREEDGWTVKSNLDCLAAEAVAKDDDGGGGT